MPNNSKPIQKYDWNFPVRVETSKGIVWYNNLTEVLTTLKSPLDELAWNRLTSTGLIAAKGDNNHLLANWWKEGWEDFSLFPQPCTRGKPVLQIKTTKFGKQLDKVFGSLRMMQREYHLRNDQVYDLLRRKRFLEDYEFVPLYKNSYTEDDYYPWTLFSADNKIIGQYKTKTEMTRRTGYSIAQINYVHEMYFNEFDNGEWVWHDEWGLLPISPRDEVLPVDWRESCKPDGATKEQLFSEIRQKPEKI